MRYEWSWESVESHTTILTPNQRLANALQEDYAHLQAHHCWETIDILSIGSWLQRSWQTVQFLQPSVNLKLLNTYQQQLLWQNIIATSKESEDLLQLNEAAKLAQSAWLLLHQWELNLTDDLFEVTADYSAFKKWAGIYIQSCHENHWIDDATLPKFLIQHIPLRWFNAKVLLAGFNDLNPQYQSLLNELKIAGCIVDYFSFRGTHEKKISRTSFVSQEQEWRSMATIAKKKYNEDPRQTMAFVIPQLEQHRDQIQQIFSEAFAEEHQYPLSAYPYPFNISAGKRLIDYPIISAAFNILLLNQPYISIDLFSDLLHSPFIGNAEDERFLRAKYDVKLRRNNIYNITPQWLMTHEPWCPALSKRLQQYYQLITTLPLNTSISTWFEIYNQLLTLMGWPGQRSLNSDEYQLVEEWFSLQSLFSSLDVLSPKQSYYQGLMLIKQMLANIVFQTKTPHAPIQVLGMLEAAGQSFEFIWLSGMDDTIWPPKAKPHPFLPRKLQILKAMPNASAQRELIYCNNLLEQFINHNPHIYFSYAEKKQDLDVAISPLIQEFPIENCDHQYINRAELIFNTSNLEKMIDHYGPPFEDPTRVFGGINVMQSQALCPFKAFAEWRLHAETLRQPTPGLQASQRGEILHGVLEEIWKRLKDQQTLLSLNDELLTEYIHQCIDAILAKYSNLHGNHYLQIEKNRLVNLIDQWLTLEKNRPAFKVVSHEKKSTVQFNQLTFATRIDRIDELANGEKIIIDYKTGRNNSISQWLGERPEAPQLPLYALQNSHDTVGISFAEVYPGKIRFKGLSGKKLDIPGIEVISWKEQIDHWQVELHQLAEEFQSGYAAISPKNAGKPCLSCELQSLCRFSQEKIDKEIIHDE